MAGVQNLKALFEKSNESTSPDRGRSGASSAAGLETPSRPLSKVRTSFVSVERAGTRSVSIESSRNIRSSSINDCEKPNGFAINNKKTIAGESALSTAPSTGAKKAARITNDEERESIIKKVKEISVTLTSKDSTKRFKAFQADSTSRIEASPLSLKSTTLTTSTKKALPKSPLTPISKVNDIKENETKSSRKSTFSKTNGYPASKSQLRNLPTHGKKQSSGASQPVRARKLAAKSPTIPVKLPASLTTHTASSSSKTTTSSPSNLSHQSLRRVSSNFQKSTGSQRRMSIASNVSLMPKAQIKKKPSNIHLQAELSKKPPRQNVLPQGATTELSFLARMTRPTASFSSKTIEKPIIATKKPSIIRSTAKTTPNKNSKSEIRRVSSNIIREKKQDIPITECAGVSIPKISKKSLIQATSNLIETECKIESSSQIVSTTQKNAGDLVSIEPEKSQRSQGDEKDLEVQDEQPTNGHVTPLREVPASILSPDSGPVDEAKEEIVHDTDTPNTEVEKSINIEENDPLLNDILGNEKDDKVPQETASYSKKEINGVSEISQESNQNSSLDILNTVSLKKSKQEALKDIESKLSMNRHSTLSLPSPSRFESYGSDAFPSPISIKCGSFEDS